MRCSICDQAERLPTRRPQLAERHRRVAVALDAALDTLLVGGADTATCRWGRPSASAA